MPAWLRQEWCTSFVLALGHFLWQGALIGIGLAIALRAAKSVAVRYWLSLSALLLMAACPVATFGWLMQPPRSMSVAVVPPLVQPEIAPTPRVGPESLIVATNTGRDDARAPAAPLDANSIAPVALPRPPSIPTDKRGWWQSFAPVVTSLYLSGVALMLLRLAIGLWGGRRLRRRAAPVTDPSMLSALQRQATALGLRLLPMLAYCERVTVPTVMGVLKPMILLPVSLASGLSPEQIESVLAHELAHLRRYDHLANLVQRVIESWLFFHPAVWWASHRAREEREHCCDDLVVACGARPLDYAKSLLIVAELSHASMHRRPVAAVSLSATGDQPSNLRQRIARLLGESATPSLRVSPRVVMSSVTILLVGLAMLIQLGVSIDRSLSATAGDESRPPEKCSATLPNGDTVELVHLTTASFSVLAQHKRVWWKGDGTLDVEANARETDPEIIHRAPLNARLVVVRAKTAASEPSLCLKTLPAADTRHQVYSDRQDQQGHPVRTFSAVFGPIGSEKSASLRVGVAPDPWGDWQQISPTGELLNKLDESRPHWSNYQQIKVLRAGPVFHTLLPPAGTPIDPHHWEDSTVVLEWPRNHDELFAFEFRAVSTDGKTHMAIDVSYSETDDPRVSTFHLNGDVFRDRLARFEYRLRPYRHWVTFENVSLQPDQPTDVKVKAESLPIEPARLVVKNADGSPAQFINAVVEAQVGFPKSRLANWSAEASREGIVSLEKLPVGTHWLQTDWGGRPPFQLTIPTERPLVEQRLIGPAWSRTNVEISRRPIVQVDDREGELIVVEIHNRSQAALNVSEADIDLYAVIEQQMIRGLSPKWLTADLEPFPQTRIEAGQNGRLRLNWREWVKKGLWSSRDGEAITEPVPASGTNGPGKIWVQVGLRNLGNLPVSVTDPKEILAEPIKHAAKLPNGVEVELAGVAMANVRTADEAQRRPDDAWWRADGTRLKRPPMKLFAASVDESQKEAREFAIKLTPAGDEPLISASHVTWTPSPPRGSSGVGGWDIDGGKPGILKLQHTAGFKDEKAVAVHVFVSDQPLGPAWLIDMNGLPLPQKPADAKTVALRKLVAIVGIEKEANETIFRSKLPRDLYSRLDFSLRAIDQLGQPHETSESRGSDAGDGRVFKLAAADIKHFEIRLRPMTHKVTFENVSLVPGEMTKVKVKVEAIDPLAPQQMTHRAGRGDPDRGPTVLLTESDEDVTQVQSVVGDLPCHRERRASPGRPFHRKQGRTHPVTV
ncbi:MAG: M56 family metallopeptidase [Planctomycetales bacterium]